MAAAADLDFGKNDLQFHCTYTQFAEICCPDVKLHKIVGWPKLLYLPDYVGRHAGATQWRRVALLAGVLFGKGCSGWSYEMWLTVTVRALSRECCYVCVWETDRERERESDREKVEGFHVVNVNSGDERRPVMYIVV